MNVTIDPAASAVTQALEEAAAAAGEPLTRPEPAQERPVKTHELLIIDYSGDLEKVWATLILTSTAASMGYKTRVFLTFWGLQAFVKDSRRITGRNLMQKMLSFMRRPGIGHRRLSQLNMFGMGPWMMFKLARKYNVATPAELLEVAQSMGVEFIPCQMTMDMFGLQHDDFIEGIGEPAGAATVLGLMASADGTLFI